MILGGKAGMGGSVTSIQAVMLRTSVSFPLPLHPFPLHPYNPVEVVYPTDGSVFRMLLGDFSRFTKYWGGHIAIPNHYSVD